MSFRVTVTVFLVTFTSFPFERYVPFTTIRPSVLAFTVQLLLKVLSFHVVNTFSFPL